MGKKNKKWLWAITAGIIVLAVVFVGKSEFQKGALIRLQGNGIVQAPKGQYDICTTLKNDCSKNPQHNPRSISCKNFENQCQRTPCYDNECVNSSPTYIIITRPLFTNTLKDFIKWKQNNGFKVGLVTVDYIDQNYSGLNVGAKIKQFITKYASKTEYFLLVGDTEINKYEYEFNSSVSSVEDIKNNIDGLYDLTKPWNVPSGYVDLQFSNSRNMMISDLYYADLSNWDKNNDGILDTQKGSEIFSFGTIVGRWPVRTPTELQNVIRKTMNMKPTNIMAFWSSWEFRGINNQSDVDKYCNNISQVFLDQGSVSTECIMYLLFGNSGNTAYSMNYVSQNDLASGNLNFVNFFLNTTQAVFASFHGYTLGIEGVSVNDVNRFTQIIPLYVPQSCEMIFYFLKSTLKSTDAFSESLIKAPKGPAVLAIPPNAYAFYKALLEGKTMGEAFYPKQNKWIMNRWYSTLFGDPSLKIFQ